MSLAARQNLRTLKSILLFVFALSVSDFALSSDTLKGITSNQQDPLNKPYPAPYASDGSAPKYEEFLKENTATESPGLELLGKAASGQNEQILKDVMKYYDHLLVKEQDEMVIIKRKTAESPDIDPNDEVSRKLNIDFYHANAIHKNRISISLPSANGKEQNGIATMHSASYSKLMPYAHIVLPDADNIAYEVIDIATFGAEKLNGTEMSDLYEIRQLVAKQHINEGPLNPTSQRRMGRDVMVVIIDSTSYNSDMQKTFGDPRIVSIQMIAKPTLDKGEALNFFNPQTRTWWKNFWLANHEKHTKQDKYFGHACGLAQAAIALCMGAVTLNLGIDKDGVFDVFPALLSYGFGTVVGMWARTYRNLTQWGNASDRLLKTSAIGLLFAYVLTMNKGFDALAMDLMTNFTSNPTEAVTNFASGWGTVLKNGVSKVLGLELTKSALLTALTINAHIFINNKLSNWAKTEFHGYNRIRDAARISTVPLMLPKNPSSASSSVGKFAINSIRSLSLASVNTFAKAFPNLTEHEYENYVSSINQWADGLIEKLPASKKRVTTLEVGAVEYQQVYITRQFPFKMFDLVGINTGTSVPLSKIILALVTPYQKYRNVLHSRKVLSQLKSKNSPHLNEYLKTHQDIERNWSEYKRLWLEPKHGIKTVAKSSWNATLAVSHALGKAGLGTANIAADLSVGTIRTCQRLLNNAGNAVLNRIDISKRR